ncbi:MAG: stage III sporulation protein AB, partial [Alicyclobacillus sp.]|nr:stage III sporulation protein AB [Alicyclobacillus sp.]
MLKAIGAALVFVASTGLGFAMARAFRNRPKQLRYLTQALRLLQAEIEYHQTPLKMALTRVAARVRPPVGGVFLTAAEGLNENQTAVTEAFAAALRAHEAHLALQPADVAVLRDLVQTLGQSDRAHQVQELEVALGR